MRTELKEKTAMYHAINDITLRGEVVVFGSTFMANFPFYELSKKYLMENAVYNRSVEGLTLAEAESVLNECVLEIRPSKIFLNLGEKDLLDPAAELLYGRIIRKIRAKLPSAEIFVLPVESAQETENGGSVYAFNEKLRTLCNQLSATFLDLPKNASSENFYEKVFKKLSRFFRDSKLTFAEAFAFAD